jgi:hypothetical protein
MEMHGGRTWLKDWVKNIIEVKQQYHSAMETISALLAAREGQKLFAIR